ncbi:uncharacterized protein LOC135136047 [Zophobas morio]|uniref:uncharacterized protein LOC135136047 n=1 Tax=Zophobas morio TaxID=2755281 RepID=UPI0030827A3B
MCKIKTDVKRLKKDPTISMQIKTYDEKTNLDLVFSNINCKVSKADSPLVVEDKHHPALVVDCYLDDQFKPNFAMNTEKLTYNFKKANYHLMYKLFSETDWSFINSICDVNQACTVFYDCIYKVFEKSVPKFKVRPPSRKSYPPWFTGDIIACIRNKSMAHRNYIRFKTPYYYNIFKSYRFQLNILIDTAYKNYISNIENSVSTNPKKFWAFVHGKKGHSKIPGVMEYNDTERTSPLSIVEGFAHYFNSVYTNSNPLTSSSNSKTRSSVLVNLETISEKDVLTALKSSKDSFTMAHDGVPSFLLKDCAYVFIKPCLYLFNLILRCGLFPVIWKKAIVCPIFKKGSQSKIVNYRPISLLCNFAKVFESILFKDIYASTKTNLSQFQHGFMEKRSTISNLASFTQYTSEAIDKKKQEAKTVKIVYFVEQDFFIIMCYYRNGTFVNGEWVYALTVYLFDLAVSTRGNLLEALHYLRKLLMI